MFCTTCGAQVHDDGEVCPKGGGPVSGDAGRTGTIVKNSGKKEPGCLVKFVRYLGRRLIALIRYLAGGLVKLVCYLGEYLIVAAIFCVVFGLLHWFGLNRVWHAAGLLKQQVELCYIERGTLCGCDGYSSGKGWDLGEAVREAESSFLITRVKIKNGVINMYPVHISLPKARCRDDEVFKGSFVPYTSSGGRAAPLDWFDLKFTCVNDHGGLFTGGQGVGCEK